MTVRVVPATAGDLPSVQRAYADARAIQRARGGVLWPPFPEAAVLAEVGAGCLYRVLDGDTVVGVFSTADADPAIWGEHERGRHLYLHRIARAAAEGPGGLFDVVLGWARERCRVAGRDGVRIDTWASNAALVAFYERRGFRLVERRFLPADPRLPAHYHGLEVALLEEGAAAGGAG